MKNMVNVNGNEVSMDAAVMLMDDEIREDDGIWKPNSEGLGMGHVFDELNKLYGENFVKYK